MIVGRILRAFGRVLLVSMSASLLSGCARPGMPPGGPEDSVPPEIVSTTPTSGTTGVDALLKEIEIEFSEDMNRSSAERSFSIVPSIALESFRWRKWTLAARPSESLPDSTTFVVTAGGTATDYHGVTMGKTHTFAFSTGAEVDAGVITGTVTAPDEKATPAVVWACPEGSARPDSLGVIEPCGYRTVADGTGAFRLGYVRAARSPYVIVAFIDQNRDGRYNVGTETGAVAAAAAMVTSAADSVGGIEVLLTTPEPPQADGKDESK